MHSDLIIGINSSAFTRGMLDLLQLLQFGVASYFCDGKRSIYLNRHKDDNNVRSHNSDCVLTVASPLATTAASGGTATTSTSLAGGSLASTGSSSSRGIPFSGFSLSSPGGAVGGLGGLGLGSDGYDAEDMIRTLDKIGVGTSTSC